MQNGRFHILYSIFITFMEATVVRPETPDDRIRLDSNCASIGLHYQLKEASGMFHRHKHSKFSTLLVGRFYSDTSIRGATRILNRLQQKYVLLL